MLPDCAIGVAGDKNNINACQEQKRCGKCISLSPDCHWCLQNVSETFCVSNVTIDMNYYAIMQLLFVPNSTTRTPATDVLYNTTNGQAHNIILILQLDVQQICHNAMPEPNISTCQDVGMWQIFVRYW